MSIATAIRTWIALLLLLAITAGSSRLDLGAANLVINLGVAAAKAALIGWFFMHLKQSPALSRFAAAAACLWLVILYVLVFADYATR